MMNCQDKPRLKLVPAARSQLPAMAREITDSQRSVCRLEGTTISFGHSYASVGLSSRDRFADRASPTHNTPSAPLKSDAAQAALTCDANTPRSLDKALT
jgi:hypothetical protein